MGNKKGEQILEYLPLNKNVGRAQDDVFRLDDSRDALRHALVMVDILYNLN